MVAATESSDRVEVLAAVPLLLGLTRSQLERLAEASQEGTFESGQTIVREGEKGTALYLILRGHAEVRRRGQPVAALAPGGFFGEAALLVEEPRTADVRATSAVRCLILSRWDFWSAVGIDPRVNRALFDETVQRLRAFRGELVE
jgi:CRP-like cAMP-binding protein